MDEVKTIRVALIMAGGGGTRLWPASSNDRPKPLIRNLAQPDATLLGGTVARLGSLVSADHVFVITTREHQQRVTQALPDLPLANILCEPAGKNTAPCIALACAHLRARLVDAGGYDPENVVLAVLPADHFVDDVEGFRQCLHMAWVHAHHRQVIVTLGIAPTYPETGYGYIEYEPDPLERDGAQSIHQATRFVEKPSHERATAFVAAGRYLWNAGIFVMPLSRVETEFAEHCPQLWQAFAPLREALRLGHPSESAADNAYAGLVPVPFDTAVMEKVNDMLVVPSAVGWSDVGNWRSVAALLTKDARGNASFQGHAGKNLLLDCDRCTIWNEEATVAAVGLSNIAIIVSNGAVLVCPQDRAQDVRWIAEALAQKQGSSS